MNNTELVIKLIKQYRFEANRYRRAQRAIASFPSSFYTEMDEAGFTVPAIMDQKRLSKRESRRFVNKDGKHDEIRAYVSAQLKAQALKKAMQDAKVCQDVYARENKTSNTINIWSDIWSDEQTPTQVKNTPVYKELGKKWRKYVAAVVEKKRAYEARWQARTGINVINKMKIAPQIKFGTTHQGCGSMNEIKWIILEDGTKMEVSKWMEQAEFENAIFLSR